MVLSSLYARGSDETYPKAIQKALDYLRTTDFSVLPDGEYPIMDQQIYAKVFCLTTKEESSVKPEKHRDYVDVQYWIYGQERFGFAPDTGQGRAINEILEEDICFYDNVLGERFVRAGEGEYAIFYPWDFHRPGLWAEGKAEECRKVVVKVKAALLTEDFASGGAEPV